MKILNVSFSNWFQNQAFYCSLIMLPFHSIPLKQNCEIFFPNLPLRDFYATVCSAMTTIFHWFWSLNFYCRPELWWWKLQKKVQAMRPSWALYAMNANFFSLTTSLLLQISLFFVVFFSLLARRFFYVTLIDIVKIATWTWSWAVSSKWTQRDEMGVRRKHGRSLMALFKNLIIKMVE